jgi:hypothetical protein
LVQLCFTTGKGEGKENCRGNYENSARKQCQDRYIKGQHFYRFQSRLHHSPHVLENFLIKRVLWFMLCCELQKVMMTVYISSNKAFTVLTCFGKKKVRKLIFLIVSFRIIAWEVSFPLTPGSLFLSIGKNGEYDKST